MTLSILLFGFNNSALDMEIEIKKKPFTIFDEYSFRCLANGYALPYTLKH